MFLRKATAFALLYRKVNKDLRVYYHFCRCASRPDGVKAITLALTTPKFKNLLNEYRHFSLIWVVADDLMYDGGYYATEETAERHKMAFSTLDELNAFVLGKGPHPFK